MILRRAHDLRFPLEIAYARSGTIATNLEQALVVFPCEIVKDDDVIGVRRVVVFAKRGIPRHDPKYIPRAPHKYSIGIYTCMSQKRDYETGERLGVTPSFFHFQ